MFYMDIDKISVARSEHASHMVSNLKSNHWIINL